MFVMISCRSESFSFATLLSSVQRQPIAENAVEMSSSAIYFNFGTWNLLLEFENKTTTKTEATEQK